MSELIQTRKDVPSGTIILNRPERKNALNRAMIADLQQAFDDFLQERTVKAVILTGSGDIFSAGADLQEISDTAQTSEFFQAWFDESQQLKTLIETTLRFPKPIITAINGPVMGTGLALMLATDIVVASDTATIEFPESRRGLSSGMTTPLMSFRIGTGVASRVLLSGQSIDASAAGGLNLFHETVPSDFVWARCQELATACAKGARESHQLTKQMINETIGETMLTQLSIGAANTAAARTTGAAKEGIAAFLEKREPDWDSMTQT